MCVHMCVGVCVYVHVCRCVYYVWRSSIHSVLRESDGKEGVLTLWPSADLSLRRVTTHGRAGDTTV